MKPYITQQQSAILTTLENSLSPLTPEQIRAQASTNSQSIGIATVYRSLNQLKKNGKLKIIVIPDAPPHYVSLRHAHQHYSYCRGCKKFTPLTGCPGGLNQLAPRGFLIQEHEILLLGLCSSCRNTD